MKRPHQWYVQAGLEKKVFQIDPDKGQPKQLLTSEPDDIVDLTFSRDKTKFAVVRRKVLTDAVMLSSTDPK